MQVKESQCSFHFPRDRLPFLHNVLHLHQHPLHESLSRVETLVCSYWGDDQLYSISLEQLWPEHLRAVTPSRTLSS
jgi:hypothetical protein